MTTLNLDGLEELGSMSALNEIFAQSKIMLCILSENGKFNKVSDSWCEALGWSHEELLALPWAVFVHPDDLEATMQVWEEAKDGKPAIKFINRYRCKDGTYKRIKWDCPGMIGTLVIARSVVLP